MSEQEIRDKLTEMGFALPFSVWTNPMDGTNPVEYSIERLIKLFMNDSGGNQKVINIEIK